MTGQGRSPGGDTGMESHASQLSLPELPDTDADISVVCVDDDREYLELVDARLSGDDRLDVRTETEPDAVLECLDRVDCVVSDYEMGGTTGQELLRSVRVRDDSLPFLLLTNRTESEVLLPVLCEPCSDYVRKSTVTQTTGLLSSRIRALVERRRTRSLARRALAAVEGVHQGVAIAGPDGRIAFADRAFERRFGYESGALKGTPWRAIYTDEEVTQFERSRLSVVEDGWRWSGDCVVEHDDGRRSTVETTVTGLADGSLVFVVSAEG